MLCSLQEVKVVDDLTSIQAPKPNTRQCDPIELGVKVDSHALSDKQYEYVKSILREYSHVFSTGPLDLGKTNLVKHSIELEDNTPFKQPYRRVPPGMYDEVRQHVKEMLDAGVIRESNSNTPTLPEIGWFIEVLFRYENVECKNAKRLLHVATVR